ncbi:MAG: hypothetical protein ACREOO_02725 [bacterium]
MLHLVLATVIVGIAIVRGMDMYSEERINQNQEEIRNKILSIAGQAQSWYYRPAKMGGGGRSFAAVDWAKLGIDPITPLASFTISEQLKESFRLTGVSLDDSTHILSYAIVYPDSITLVP